MSDPFAEWSYRAHGGQAISRLLSRLFLVPKPSNHWRPVTDLSFLSDFIKILKFKMDIPQNIKACMMKGHWVFNLDWKDAYFQIPIHPKSWNYLMMEYLGKIYQFRALPLGISSLAFQKSNQHSQVTFPPVKYVQVKGGGTVTDLRNITNKELKISLSTKHSVSQDTLKIMESILRKHVDNIIVVFVLCIAYSQIFVNETCCINT